MSLMKKFQSFSSLSQQYFPSNNKYENSRITVNFVDYLEHRYSSTDVEIFRKYKNFNQNAKRPPIFGTILTSSKSEKEQFTDIFHLKRSEESPQALLDVTTGHLILSYMEEHVQNRDKLEADWEAITSYISEEAVPCEAALKLENYNKNRKNCPIPYEHTRVLLSCRGNEYINASLIYDCDPRAPTYIATITPLPETVNDFWQMVWEKFSVVIVSLEPESNFCQTTTNGQIGEDNSTQARFWPHVGSTVFGNFEIRLVSEHSQCVDYIIRSFYLRQIDSGETRTVTQFHFLSWLDDVPTTEIKVLLEFRRKVNKSFRAKNSPIVVHCFDGSAKTGAYLLLDMVLNRINRGLKELDVAASLEYLRDQREGMIKSRAQYELVIGGIAEEVMSILHMTS